MLPNVKDFIRPKTIPEAVKILKKHKGTYIPLAGSTSLGESENPRIEGLVDLSALRLVYIKSTGGALSIGAMTTLEEIANDSKVSKYASGVVTHAAASVGKITNRNLITAGGNIVQIHPWSILPVVCLALDAKIIIASPAKKSVSAEEFFKTGTAPKKILSDSAIVVEVQFPKSFSNAAARFEKFALTENDYPLISVCVAATKKSDGTIGDMRIVAGALALAPQRFNNAEKIILSQKPNGKIISNIADTVAEEAIIGNDIRVSKDYKKEVLRKLIVANLEEIFR